jgi:site-specific recombinase XerD
VRKSKRAKRGLSAGQLNRLYRKALDAAATGNLPRPWPCSHRRDTALPYSDGGTAVHSPLEHLVAECNLSRNTQRSYRDAPTLLIPFVAGKLRQVVDRLTVADVSADLVRLFLADLKQARSCAATTRNQRLARAHALSRFVGGHSPEHNCLVWPNPLHPVQEDWQNSLLYLDKPQMDALLAALNRDAAQGHREHALLLFLYNFGARAEEAAQ